MNSKSEQKRQNFETGAVVLILSTVIVKFIGVFFKIPISNFLGDKGYGCFSSAYDLFTPFYAMAMSGLPVGTARLISGYKSEKRYADVKKTAQLSRKLFYLTGIAGFVLFLLLTPFLSRITDDKGNTFYGLLSIAPSILLFCVMSYYRGIYEGFSNMVPTAVSDLIEAFGKLILGFGLSFITYKFTNNIILSAASTLFGITLGVAFADLYLILKYRKDKVRDKINREAESQKIKNTDVTLKKLIKILLPVTASAVAITVFASFTDALTVKSCLEYAGIEDSTVLYGLRSKAFTLYNLVPSVTAVIGISAVPMLSVAKAENDNCLLRKKAELILKTAAVISVPAGFGMAVLSRPVMTLIYSSEPSGKIGAQLLQIFGVAAVFSGICVVLIHSLQALGKQNAVLITLFSGIAVKLVLNLILIRNPRIGILGAAYSTLISYIVLFAVSLILFLKSTGKINIFRIFAKPIIATAAFSVIVFFVGNELSKIKTVLVILLCAVVYFSVIILLKTFSFDELEDFPGGKKLKKISFR